MEKLKNELLEKDRICKEIQSEYENLLKTAEKDNTLLLEKTKEIQLLKRNLNLKEKRKHIEAKDSLGRMSKEESVEKILNEIDSDEEEDLELDSSSLEDEVELQNYEDEYSVMSNNTQKELRMVDGTIHEKEELLKNITENQLLLEKV